MRVLNRPRVLLPTLSVTKSGGKKAAKNESLFKTQPIKVFLEKRGFPDHWNKEDVRGALYAMHGRVCAFCQCSLPRNDRGDVEHFRPKSKITQAPGHHGYWWLAYEFTNYLLSCSTCNQTHKLNYFKLEPGDSNRDYSTRDQVHQEKRLLLNPAEDEVEALFKLDMNQSLLPIKPADGISPTDKLKVNETTDLFYFNMNPDLIENRRRAVNKAKEAIAQNRIQHLQKMASRYVADSWTVREYLKFRNLEEHIPGPDLELRFFLEDLVQHMDRVLKLLKVYPDKEKLKKTLAETFWSLAVLWFDPPALEKAEIKEFLENAGVIDPVTELYRQLKPL